jgi:hypothetical protein
MIMHFVLRKGYPKCHGSSVYFNSNHSLPSNGKYKVVRAGDYERTARLDNVLRNSVDGQMVVF